MNGVTVRTFDEDEIPIHAQQDQYCRVATLPVDRSETSNFRRRERGQDSNE